MSHDPVDSGTSLMRSVRADGVREVRIIFVDYNGLSRARSVLADRLPSVLDRGVNFSSPTVDFNSQDLFPSAAAFDLASPDFWARPDTSTYRPVPPLPDVGQMYSDLVTAQGEPWEGCPRTALRRLVDQGQARGLRFNVGFEPEGYLLRRSDERLEFADIPEFATVDGLDRQGDFMRDLLSELEAGRVGVEQWSKEYGPGQIEVNLRYTSPIEACDQLVTFKQIFRSLARRKGLHGTFMPKPFTDQAGTGLHVHLSATPMDDPGTNLFDEPAEPHAALSAVGRSALAGLLLHGEALTALGATTVNSYKRFLPGSWAPTHIYYAYASRAAFVRVPERETARRLELRIGDAAGNPYLFLTGILAAMLDGIERRLEPGPPVPGNVGTLTDEEALVRGARPLPRTLRDAMRNLERNEVMRAALGDLIVDELVKIKLSEWDAFCMHVGQWDRQWYLERY